MAAQFLAEGREDFGFVSTDGKLLQRTKGITYGPNYPRAPTPPPGPGPPPTDDGECSTATAAALTVGDPIIAMPGDSRCVFGLPAPS